MLFHCLKKGSKDMPGNCRPVSLTAVVGKLLDRILRDRINLHLDSQDRIRDSQYGIVHGRSRLTNLSEFFKEVTKRINEVGQWMLSIRILVRRLTRSYMAG